MASYGSFQEKPDWTHGDREILFVALGFVQYLLGLLDRWQDIRLAILVSLRGQRPVKQRVRVSSRKHLLGQSNSISVFRCTNPSYSPTPRLIFLGDLSAFHFSVTPAGVRKGSYLVAAMRISHPGLGREDCPGQLTTAEPRVRVRVDSPGWHVRPCRDGSAGDPQRGLPDGSPGQRDSRLREHCGAVCWRCRVMYREVR